MPGVWSTDTRLSDTVEVQSAALLRRSDGYAIPGRFAFRVVLTVDGTQWRGPAHGSRKAALEIARRHVEGKT